MKISICLRILFRASDPAKMYPNRGAISSTFLGFFWFCIFPLSSSPRFFDTIFPLYRFSECRFPWCIFSTCLCCFSGFLYFNLCAYPSSHNPLIFLVTPLCFTPLSSPVSEFPLVKHTCFSCTYFKLARPDSLFFFLWKNILTRLLQVVKDETPNATGWRASQPMSHKVMAISSS